MNVLTRTVVLALVVLVVGVSAEEDYIILLDSSENVISPNFDTEIRFTVSLAKKLFNNGNRIGLFTFAENTHKQFSLDQYNDLHQVEDGITYMWFSTGNGEVGPAVREVLEKGFISDNGDRDCTSNILIVLTHSAITDSSIAAELKEKLEDKLIRLYVLNMAGNNESIVFDYLTNSTNRVLDIASYNQLGASLSTLVNMIKTDITPPTGCGVLTQWQPWTRCSATCNSGLRFRLRTCQRLKETDKGCNGELSETDDCFAAACNHRLDGGWANWQTWEQCSKTCGTGTQSRARECAAPRPRNGGKRCPGSNNQVRNCSKWQCPDCTKRCSPGSHLTDDCSLCVCSNITIFGRIMDDTKRPVQNASVFLDSRRYKAVTTTNQLGFFESSGICISNETVTVESDKHLTGHLVPLEFNLTHWIVNSTLVTSTAPMFTVHPHDKIRMVGQHLTLCCSAVGKPSPNAYKWYKDGTEIENVGVNGTLIIPAVKLDDAATYKCSTETRAGVSLSEEATIEVKEQRIDTCGIPSTSLYEMPFGCYRAGDMARSSSVDVGTCGKAACVSDSLHDNGTCADWWTHHCCDVHDSDEIEIICDGFSYTVTRIRSCKCKPCVSKTSISGRVNGVENGTLVPMRLGSVIVNGETVARTNMAGFFRFDVSKGMKRVIATFVDTYFKQCLSITKVIKITEGSDNYIAVKVVLKPIPISFNPNLGKTFVLGDADRTAAGSLSIPEDSLIDEEGNPYNGNAHASLHFMDPRNMENLDTAYGEFVAESTNGEKNSLQTYGIVSLDIRTDDGKGLKIGNPVTIRLDASLYNVTLDGNGETDIALWNYDINKGIWVEASKMKIEKNPLTGRRLLQSSNYLVANISKNEFPTLSHDGVKEVHTSELTYQWNSNGDRIIPFYKDVVTMEPYVKDGACFVSVSVYEDQRLIEPYKQNDVTIKVYTLDPSSKIAIGSSERLLQNGHVCIETFCDKLVVIRAENGNGERLFTGKHFLPPGYPHENINKTQVNFESRNFGQSLDCTNLSLKCEGPMYFYTKRSHCNDVATDDDSFQFKFAPLAGPPKRTPNLNNYDTKLSWYPMSPDKATFRSCFMKVNLRIEGNYNIRLFGISYLNRATNESYGTYNVGFAPDPKKPNITVRGACMEFRCPGYVKDGGKEYFDRPTIVAARLNTNNQTLKCRMQPSIQSMQFTPISNQNQGEIGFRFRADAGQNYGSNFGIYIHDKDPNEVDQLCKSGFDTGPNIDGMMEPSRNYAVEFNCL